MGWVLPGDTHRTFIVGRTGMGKTQAGMWILSLQNWDEMPWIVMDFKRDAHVMRHIVPRAKMLKIDDPIPSQPGLYVVQPLPTDEAYQEVNDFLHRIWEHENVGIFVDEGQQIATMSGLKLLQKQGRSKRTPMIVLFQRPVGISRDVLTEADYYMIFRLKHADDRIAISKAMEDEHRPKLNERLEKYHSLWYDDESGELIEVNPTPDMHGIEKLYNAKMFKMIGQKPGDTKVIKLR